MTNQLKYSNGSDAFTFFRSAIKELSENQDRDLFVLDIPFQRDAFVMDFVDTSNTITISGLLNTPSGSSDSTAYNSTDGGGCTGQLERLRLLSVPDNDGQQSLLYLTITDYGNILTNVPVFIPRMSYRTGEDYPVGVISYSLELKRAQIV